jgi:DNA-binding winged helix-turn-helix (wHTH) protein/uncharacterized DUF497 family protein
VEASSQRPHALRFGIFEMDLDSEELRKNGLRIKLTGQPFRLLAEVAEHTGRVVTYEELQVKFWHGVTIEDPRHSLSNSMLKIREALGDSANRPRYIETVSRGYKFLAPVEFIATVSTNGNNSATEATSDLLLEMRRIRQQLPITLQCRDLALLLYECERLGDHYAQYCNLPEFRTLVGDIKSAIKHSALTDPHWADHSISFEIAAGVFDDPNAVSVPDPFVPGNWKTIGRIFESVLIVLHTGRGEHGRQVVRIIEARRATPAERRFYGHARK